MRKTVVLSASAAFGVLVFCAAALLLAQQAQAQSVPEPPCTTSFCIDKTADQSTVTVGEPITFTITQRCLGQGTCVDGRDIVDEVPSGLSIVSVDANDLDDPDYQCTTSGHTVTCAQERFFTETRPFSLTIVATPTECGTFTNTASNGADAGSVTFKVGGCPPPLPTTKAQCKKGGFREFGYPDQGTCISDVNRRNR
jgi:uncharacterized repeat protein (TIGR01451 family)